MTLVGADAMHLFFASRGRLGFCLRDFSRGGGGGGDGGGGVCDDGRYNAGGRWVAAV